MSGDMVVKGFVVYGSWKRKLYATVTGSQAELSALYLASSEVREKQHTPLEEFMGPMRDAGDSPGESLSENTCCAGRDD